MPNRFKVPLILFGVVVAVFILWFAGHSARRVEVKRYSMTGLVVAVHPESGTASVHNDNIPGFMQAMEMEYRISDPAMLPRLKRGDNIRATLVSDGRNLWQLENVVVTSPGASR
ncbi:MAG TPA: copper-binding protein [Terriglobales bacterium]